MDKKRFIHELSEGLRKHEIYDFQEIINDYENHFTNELSKGKTEEEIAKALGDIKQIIKDFTEEKNEKKKQISIIVLGSIVQNIIMFPVILLLYGLFITLMSVAIGSLSIGIYYMFSINSIGFLPLLSFPLSQLYGITFLSLAVLIFSFSMIYFNYLNKIVNQYIEWQKSMFGKENYDVIASILNFKLYVKLLKYSSVVFIFLLVLTVIISALIARGLQFWHLWGWFQ